MRDRGNMSEPTILYIFFAKSYYFIYLHFYSLTPQFQQFLHITTVFRNVIRILIEGGLKEESIFFFFNENPKQHPLCINKAII
jgi:hypothetical protein